MLNGMVALLRRRYGLVQIVVVLIWFVLEIAGYGIGLLDGLFHRRLTNADATRGIGSWMRSAPPGPVRLSRSDRAALEARMAATFGATPPKYVSLSDLRWMYELQPGSLCDWRGSNVASDPAECNRLKAATPFFRALLDAMHPKTEALMLEDVSGFRGDKVRVAFFAGRSERPQILFDLSGLNGNHWKVAAGFKLKAYHGGGLTELTLGAPVSSDTAIYVIDDPGVLKRRRGDCGASLCLASLLLYGFDHQGGRETDGKLASSNLANIELSEALEQRFVFQAVLLGKTVASPAALPDTPFEVKRIAVTKFQTVSLDRALDVMLGAGSSTRVTYAASGYDVAFGRVYGVSIDNKLYTLWDGGPGFESLGTDRMVFDVVTGNMRRRLDGVRSANGVYLLPYSGTQRLEVRKFIAQDGKPWSAFELFEDLLATLRDTRR